MWRFAFKGWGLGTRATSFKVYGSALCIIILPSGVSHISGLAVKSQSNPRGSIRTSLLSHGHKSMITEKDILGGQQHTFRELPAQSYFWCVLLAMPSPSQQVSWLSAVYRSRVQGIYLSRTDTFIVYAPRSIVVSVGAELSQACVR